MQNIQERDGEQEERPIYGMSNGCFLTLLPIKEQLKAIAIMKRVTAEYGELTNPLFFTALSRLQRIVCAKHRDSMKQCRIDIFFQ